MQKHSFKFKALGTYWQVETIVQLPLSLIHLIEARIKSFDKTYSRFRKDSLIFQISQHAGSYVFPEDGNILFDFYKKLYDSTSGKITPLIGDVLERAGYDANYSFEVKPQKAISGWDEVLEWKGTSLKVTQPVMLDFGAAGKGYLIDIVGQLLVQNNIFDFVVDGSGDLMQRGKIDNVVGLEHPLRPGEIIGTIEVINQSLCASATNRRVWGNGFHHIFDPDSLKPTEQIIATWVIATDTITADGLATALFFTEPLALASEFSFEYVRMHAGGAIDYSSIFEGQLYT